LLPCEPEGRSGGGGPSCVARRAKEDGGGGVSQPARTGADVTLGRSRSGKDWKFANYEVIPTNCQAPFPTTRRTRPSPLAGEGGSRSETDEGWTTAWRLARAAGVVFTTKHTKHTKTAEAIIAGGASPAASCPWCPWWSNGTAATVRPVAEVTQPLIRPPSGATFSRK